MGLLSWRPSQANEKVKHGRGYRQNHYLRTKKVRKKYKNYGNDNDKLKDANENGKRK